MRRFFIITNPDKAGAKDTEQEICRYLEKKGAVCAMPGRRPGMGAGGPVPAGGQTGVYTDPEQVPQDTECVITIGGDGTLIQAARDLAGRNLPFLGVNRGHLGYLTQIGGDRDLTPALDALLEGSFDLEKRMMLEGCVEGSGTGAFSDLALNEIVISRKETFKPLHFRILVNGEFLNDYTADGMIFATPTGSTAYNLSAGGPIVAPASRMVVLTPICSHALSARSIVLPAEDEITVEFLEDSCMAAFDGNPTGMLGAGDRVVIHSSGISTTLVQLEKISFLQNLSIKMSGI